LAVSGIVTEPSARQSIISPTRSNTMLSWAITFFILAIIAGIFGFGGIASGAAGIAQFLFFLFIVLLVISLLTGRFRRDPMI